MAIKYPQLYIISEHYKPSTGATAQLVYDLSFGLSELGIDVVVITSTHDDGSDSCENIRTVRLGLGNSSNVKILGKALAGISFSLATFFWLCFKAKRNVNLLIVSNPPFIVLIGLFYRLFTHTHYFFLLQDLFPRSAELTGVLPVKGPLSGIWRYLIGLSCTFSKSTIVLSNAMKYRACSEYGLNPSNIKVIHNWAIESPTHLPKHKNPLAIAWGVDKKLTVQYSGNFGRLHDLITILEAARLLTEYPIHFLFIGGGAKLTQIKAYVHHYDLQNISIKPYQPRHLLPLSLAACDMAAVALIPGSDDTVAPSKLYGILSSAKPVLAIVTQPSELSDLITREKCGVVVSPGDPSSLATSLIDLYLHPNKLQKMSDAASQTYKKLYGKNKSIKDYFELLLS